MAGTNGCGNGNDEGVVYTALYCTITVPSRINAFSYFAYLVGTYIHIHPLGSV